MILSNCFVNFLLHEHIHVLSRYAGIDNDMVMFIHNFILYVLNNLCSNSFFVDITCNCLVYKLNSFQDKLYT